MCENNHKKNFHKIYTKKSTRSLSLEAYHRLIYYNRFILFMCYLYLMLFQCRYILKANSTLVPIPLIKLHVYVY